MWSNPIDFQPETSLILSLAALIIGASWVCYFRALELGTASQVAPVDKFSLVLVASFAFAFLGEHPSMQERGGIGLVTSGVLSSAIKPRASSDASQTWLFRTDADKWVAAG